MFKSNDSLLIGSAWVLRNSYNNPDSPLKGVIIDNLTLDI